MGQEKSFFSELRILKTLITYMCVSDIFIDIVTWMKISLKCAYGQEEMLGDVSRGLGRQADG